MAQDLKLKATLDTDVAGKLEVIAKTLEKVNARVTSSTEKAQASQVKAQEKAELARIRLQRASAALADRQAAQAAAAFDAHQKRIMATQLKAEGDKNKATEAAQRQALKIQQQAEIAEASIVKDRFERLKAVENVKHQQALRSLQGNQSAIEAETRRHNAKIAAINMTARNFPDTPFQRLLGQLQNLVPAGSQAAKAFDKVRNSQSGFVDFSRRAVDGAAKAGSAVMAMGGRVRASIGSNDMMKFLGLKAALQQVEQLGRVVFQSAIKQSPQLAAMVSKAQDSFNRLVTEVAGQLVPILTQGFEFILKHWDKVRFGITMGINLILDTFDLFKLGVMSTWMNLKIAATGIATLMNKVGIVSDETLASLTESTKETAAATIDMAVSTRIYGRTVDQAKAGMEGMGAAAAANVDVFNQNAKAVETLEQRLKRLRDMDNGNLKRAVDEKKRQDEMRRAEDEADAADEERMAEKEATEREASQKMMMANVRKKKAQDEARRSEAAADREDVERQKERNEKRVQATAGMFNGMAALAATANMKDRANRMRLKALLIAEATANASLAITKAYASAPFPFNLAAVAGVAAGTTAQIINIKNQKYARGTNRAPGGAALVGEEGPELVELPAGAKVNTAGQTREKMSRASSINIRGGDVIIQGNATPEAVESFRQVRDEMDKRFIDKVVDALGYAIDYNHPRLRLA